MNLLPDARSSSPSDQGSGPGRRCVVFHARLNKLSFNYGDPKGAYGGLRNMTFLKGHRGPLTHKGNQRNRVHF